MAQNLSLLHCEPCNTVSRLMSCRDVAAGEGVMVRVVLFSVRSAVVGATWMTVGEDGSDWRHWHALAALAVQAVLTGWFITISVRGRRAERESKVLLLGTILRQAKELEMQAVLRRVK